MKKRKIIAGLIAQKFLKDLDAILDGFNIEQQIHITETLKKIYKIIIEPKNNEKPYNLRYKKADKIYNEELLKRYGKLFVKANSINILSYFDPSVLMCKSVGDTDLDFCTNAEFNQLDEQELSDFEFKQLSEGIRNCLSSTLSNLYSKSNGTELAQTEKNLNGNDVLKKENNTLGNGAKIPHKRGRKPKIETLKDIWVKDKDVSIIQGLRMSLSTNNFTKQLEDGSYQWKVEIIKLVALSEVLKDKKLVEKGNQSKIARALCNEFNIPVDVQSFKNNNRPRAETHKSLFNELIMSLSIKIP